MLGELMVGVSVPTRVVPRGSHIKHCSLAISRQSSGVDQNYREREKFRQQPLAEKNADCEQLQATEENLSQWKFPVSSILKQNYHFKEYGKEQHHHGTAYP